MFGAFHKRGWRGAIGLIAAYAIVLQAFLAYSMASQAAAQNASAYTGAFFVLCTSQDNPNAQHDDGAPLKLNTHRPVCTLSGSEAATLPDPVSLPIWQGVAAGRTPFVSIAACISFPQRVIAGGAIRASFALGRKAARHVTPLSAVSGWPGRKTTSWCAASNCSAAPPTSIPAF